MKITMLTRIEGTRNAQRWPEAGSTIDLPEGEALDLISTGLAKRAADEPEMAVAPEAEVSEKPVAKKAVAKKAEKRA